MGLWDVKVRKYLIRCEIKHTTYREMPDVGRCENAK